MSFDFAFLQHLKIAEKPKSTYEVDDEFFSVFEALLAAVESGGLHSEEDGERAGVQERQVAELRLLDIYTKCSNT